MAQKFDTIHVWADNLEDLKKNIKRYEEKGYVCDGDTLVSSVAGPQKYHQIMRPAS